ncbi:energy-coupling factor transporter transmembrane component T family protein [Methanococcoides alaskense]|uniref:Energy-coupling factor transport system permease protein n=1 Tax=Methanococcoides alaskense TaxID=325778 RepID=A0AA90TYN6_9EURY|nr:energy-coupling factor transporter transmembrane component T [Methanococcoides alaskense]MDR6222371.1 energy-coupling factor transport system permease protein [Methanococcoides alaskense]
MRSLEHCRKKGADQVEGFLFSYVAGKSILHGLDPRVKIFSVMCLSILIFRSSALVDLLVFTLLFVGLTIIAGSGLSGIRSVRPLFPIFVFIFLMHFFFTEGVALFDSQFSPTYEGLLKGSLVTVRFVLLILYGSLLTSTTRPAVITTGIERILRPLPLRRVGVTSFEIATMMSLALYFMPHLLWYAGQVKDSQLSRGSKYRRDPISGTLSLAIPVLKGSMRMADDVAMAMESRCYQGNFRTSLFELKMTTRDVLVFSFVLGVTALVLYV